MNKGAVSLIANDLTKIRQSLFNLLSNAAKFTEKGKIGVAVTCPEGTNLIEVNADGTFTAGEAPTLPEDATERALNVSTVDRVW